MPTPLPVLPGVYYGYVYGTYLGKKCGSVFTFKVTPTPTSPTEDGDNAAALAVALVNAWATNMAPRYPSAYGGLTSRVYPLGNPTLPPNFATAAGTGSAGADVAPTASAAVVRHSVLRRGRGSQSHTAISPISKGEVTADGTSLTGSAAAGLTSDFNAFLAGTVSAFLTATGATALSYVQLSKKGSGATYAITGSAAETLLGTERSRTARP